MLTTLIVSGPRPKGAWRRQFPGLTFSMAAHALMFYTAAMATMHQGTDERTVPSDTGVIYVGAQPPSPVEPPPPLRPEKFRTVVAPVTIPTSIPPIDVTATFDPRDYTGIGTPLNPEGAGPSASASADLYVEALVDEPPVRIAFPPPEYPRLLLEARIEGSVILEVVVDTLGHPEPGSIKVVRSTNRGFEPAAMDALRRALFRAGRVQGQRVRVLVRQPIRFKLPN